MASALHAISEPSHMKDLEREVTILQSQCADNPAKFYTLINQAIARREIAIKDGKQRQEQLTKLNEQLNDEEDDSQDNVSIKNIVGVMGLDRYKRIPDFARKEISLQCARALFYCYPDVDTDCVHEKAYLAFLCARAVGYVNNIQQQEINELQKIAATPAEQLDF